MSLKYSVVVLTSVMILLGSAGVAEKANAEEPPSVRTLEDSLTSTELNQSSGIKPANEVTLSTDSSVKEAKEILTKAETVSTQAETLNQDIIAEIERIKQDRILAEQKNLEEAKKIEAQVKAKAEELNNQIIAELERVREEKRLEQERLIALEQAQKAELEKFLSSGNQTNFQGFDIRTKSNLKAEQLDALLVGTGLQGLGSAYVQAEKDYNVNALALLSISAIESSWGNSNMAKKKNNIFGYQAYDYNTDAARVFVSKEESILVVASHLQRNYLTPGGPYHNGYTLAAVNVRYASDKLWNVKITAVMNRLLAKLN